MVQIACCKSHGKMLWQQNPCVTFKRIASKNTIWMVWKCFRVALHSIASIACIIVVLVCASVASAGPTGTHERVCMATCVCMIVWECAIVFVMLCVCTNQLLSKAQYLVFFIRLTVNWQWFCQYVAWLCMCACMYTCVYLRMYLCMYICSMLVRAFVARTTILSTKQACLP